ncbi:metallophosphoesterase [Geotalea sp. SG265]|uniref:metallophosphoesterase n=1 Tax=Geotalea sp. SG265 TaxID=2922867 RepID=UPI001FAEB386|nr:metallophosphoesterase [Geotalea sp. SG265]
MSLFLLTFFVLYGGVHVYAFIKIRGAISLGAGVSGVLAIFFLLMVVGPVLVRVTERHGLESLASSIAHISYTWMGFLFLYFSASIAVDLYRFLVFILGKLLHHDISFLVPATAVSFYLPLLLAAAISVYGFFEARSIRTERVTLASSKLPAGIEKLVLVQISDLHLGLMVRKDRLIPVLEKIKAENPDVVVSTGDLVDGQLDGLADLVPLLRDLNPPLGKFAVTGNHEFYAGFPQALSFTEQAGFRLLRQKAVPMGDAFILAGVDDPAAHRGSPPLFPEHVFLSSLPRDRFILLLKHRPVMDPASLGLFDLQLSGHVHKGQIFPFNLLTHLFYPVKMGLSNSSLYVSRGTGTWGPPIRFLAPPEITVITIVPSC